MKPSNRPFNPKDLLNTVLSLLEEEFLRHAIDEPIQRAAAGFLLPSPNPPPHGVHSFLDLIAAYISHLYQYGLKPARVLTPCQSRKEAVCLLNSLYVGGSGRGFERAYLDCLSEGEFRVEYILIQLAESLKNTLRTRHIQSVLNTHVLCLEWEKRRAVVELCLERFGSTLPEEIRKGPPDRFTPQCGELVLLLADVKNHLGDHLGGS